MATKQDTRKGKGGNSARRERPEFDQKMLDLSRVTRVVKGGRRFRFRATLVIGNRKGQVGVGVAKGSDVSDSIQKAYNDAKKNLVTVVLDPVTMTIPHAVLMKLGAARVLLKPGFKGQGVIAGGAVRAVVDLLGVKDIVSKSLGASNPLNVARATVKALGALKTPKQRTSVLASTVGTIVEDVEKGTRGQENTMR